MLLCVVDQQASDLQAAVSPWNDLQLDDNSKLTQILLSSQEFEKQIKEWCKEAGEDVTYKFAQVSALQL